MLIGMPVGAQAGDAVMARPGKLIERALPGLGERHRLARARREGPDISGRDELGEPLLEVSVGQVQPPRQVVAADPGMLAHAQQQPRCPRRYSGAVPGRS